MSAVERIAEEIFDHLVDDLNDLPLHDVREDVRRLEGEVRGVPPIPIESHDVTEEDRRLMVLLIYVLLLGVGNQAVEIGGWNTRGPGLLLFLLIVFLLQDFPRDLHNREQPTLESGGRFMGREGQADGLAKEAGLIEKPRRLGGHHTPRHDPLRQLRAEAYQPLWGSFVVQHADRYRDRLFGDHEGHCYSSGVVLIRARVI